MAEKPKQTMQDILNINAVLYGDKDAGVDGLLALKGLGVGTYSLSKLAGTIRPLIQAYRDTLESIREKYKPFIDEKTKEMPPDKMKEMAKEFSALPKEEEATVLPKVKLTFLEKIPQVTPLHLLWLGSAVEE